MENKVISREYVEKNCIYKKDLEAFINAELNMIEKCRKDTGFITNQQYDGMESAYRSIKNIYLGGINE